LRGEVQKSFEGGSDQQRKKTTTERKDRYLEGKYINSKPGRVEERERGIQKRIKGEDEDLRGLTLPLKKGR